MAMAEREQFVVQTTVAKTQLFWLIGMFLLLAPASVTSDTGGDDVSYLKWARVILLGIVAVLGLRWLRWPKHGDVSGKLLAVAGIFWMSAIWSSSPVWGLAYKGMFVASIVAGIGLANALRTEGDFRSFGRMMTLTTLFGAGIVLYVAATQDMPVFVKGRLVVGRLNPNLMAQSAAVFALLCLFHMLIRDTSRWMMMATVACGTMLVLTVLTGSRGAVLMLASGLVVLFPVVGRNRSHILALSAVSITVLGMVGTYWLFSVEAEDEYSVVSAEESVELRIFRELTKDTRYKVWRGGVRQWLQNPVIGKGWLTHDNRWSTVQSAYLQILVETGIVGAVPMMLFLIAALLRIREALVVAKSSRGLACQLCYVFSATLFALLFHAAFESSAVTGASPNAVILGFCVAQLDHLVRLVKRQRDEQAVAARQTVSPYLSPVRADLAGVRG